MKNIVIPVMCCALSIAVAMYLQLNAVQGKAQRKYYVGQQARQQRIEAVNAGIVSTGGDLQQQLLDKVLAQEQEMREMRENQADLLDQIKQLQQSQLER